MGASWESRVSAYSHAAVLWQPLRSILAAPWQSLGSPMTTVPRQFHASGMKPHEGRAWQSHGSFVTLPYVGAIMRVPGFAARCI